MCVLFGCFFVLFPCFVVSFFSDRPFIHDVHHGLKEHDAAMRVSIAFLNHTLNMGVRGCGCPNRGSAPVMLMHQSACVCGVIAM